MFFKGEGACVCVVILDHARWADRRAVMDSIMRASACAGKASRTYLALPKTAASLADAGLFQEYGIGLFTYDQRNVEEALPARYFEISDSAASLGETVAAGGQLRNELRELHSELGMLQRVVQQLKEELASLAKSVASKEFVRTVAPHNSLQGVHVVESLPTFFSGNPWLEVLSRRGREEAAIAG